MIRPTELDLEYSRSFYSKLESQVAAFVAKPAQLPQIQTRNQNWRQRLQAWQLLQDWGDTSTSYMTLNPANRLFFEEQGRAYLAYRQRFGVALTLGDPVGNPAASQQCLEQFLQFCRSQRVTPVFFAVEKNHCAYHSLNLRKMQIAEDAYLDLKCLEFKGKCWQDVRTALNRAKREQISFHELAAGQKPPTQLLNQFEEVSTEWLRSKKLPQLGFTLGDLPTMADPAVRTFYAMDAHGRVQGLVSWLPMRGARGWALDLMRKRDGSMQGLMEFLIAGAALRFQAEGYARLGLGAAPFAPIQQDRLLSPLERLSARVTPMLNYFYGFNSLFAFKRKFRPEWKPLYLFYPATRCLPRISLALVSLYLSRRP